MKEHVNNHQKEEVGTMQYTYQYSQGTVSTMFGFTLPYKKVFEGTVDGVDSFDALEKLFVLHNQDLRPLRTSIRSMSVGDVVELFDGKDTQLFVCDLSGWTKIGSIFEEGK